jgi:hypothetical protein
MAAPNLYSLDPVTDIDGNELDLAGFKGKLVVVVNIGPRGQLTIVHILIFLDSRASLVSQLPSTGIHIGSLYTNLVPVSTCV